MKTMLKVLLATGLVSTLLAQNDDVLVRDPEGNEFILCAVGDFDQEIARTRKNQKLMALLDARSTQSETIPLAEVKRRLGL